MKTTTNFDTEFVCYCKSVTLGDLKCAFLKNRDITYSGLQSELSVGTQCASCEYEVKGALDDYRAEVGIASEIDDRPLFLKRQGVRGTLREIVSTLRKKNTRNMKAGLFCLRQTGLETSLLVSNLNFPEMSKNPNGSKVMFKVSHYGHDGELRAVSRKISLPANSSREYPLNELFPTLSGDLLGAIYIEFFNLKMTGSLRPYALLRSTGLDGSEVTRTHFHDQYATFTTPGYFQTVAPSFPGQTCWTAISNCQNRPYESKVFLKTADARFETELKLGPMQTIWQPLLNFFPQSELAGVNLDPALFYLENPQNVMVWFFMKSNHHNTWIANHH